VACGKTDEDSVLHADHFIPWILGGLTALWNLLTLCESCNLTKSYYFVRRNGTIAYPPGASAETLERAGDITETERRRRMHPKRWFRAAYGMRWI
jgi:5-methylcytosine-specific restriction endonuclease McrA